MSDQYSVVGILLEASIVVQVVMILLVITSLMSWGVIIGRWKEYKSSNAAMVAFEERFWSGIDLGRLFLQTNTSTEPQVGQEKVFRAGFKEFNRLCQTKGTDVDSIMDGVSRAMRVTLLRERDRLEAHLPFLATVGSTSPYLGLFGTVWGIMTAFLSLANAQQATLNVVAPSIAEALIATAIGLAAAIPAVIAYNKFATQSDQLVSSYDAFSDEFSSILHRQAHVFLETQKDKAASATTNATTHVGAAPKPPHV